MGDKRDEEWTLSYLSEDAEACSAVNGTRDASTKDARRIETTFRKVVRERDDAAAALAARDARIAELEAEREKLREALSWYGEQALLARLIHSGGDAGRHALASDGGSRARAALQETGHADPGL